MGFYINKLYFYIIPMHYRKGFAKYCHRRRRRRRYSE